MLAASGSRQELLNPQFHRSSVPASHASLSLQHNSLAVCMRLEVVITPMSPPLLFSNPSLSHYVPHFLAL